MSIVLKKFSRSKMYLDSKDKGISATLLRNWRKREAEFLYMMLSTLSPGDIFCDVGANLGYNTVRASEVLGKRGFYVAIEPDPRNVVILRKNMKLNGLRRATVIQCAVSSTNGNIRFHTSKKSNLGSLYRNRHINGSLVVNTKTLTALAHDTGIRPTFYKMDIEGAEAAALDGAMELFKSDDVPTKILIEVHQPMYKRHRIDFAPSLKNLFAAGFKPALVASAGLQIPALFKKAGYKPIKTFGGRGVYSEIATKHVLDWACRCHKDKTSSGRITPRIIRSILLKRD